MAGGGGAGPSRRSHTKSRKGCKTCKRRHIRCDETFPQCRNCTKHQVRCDYMEHVGPGSDGRLTPDQPRLLLSPETESFVDLWQQTGAFPFPQLSSFPQLYAHDYTRDELRLLVHLASICNTMNMRGTSNLALWTMHIPQFLQLGVVHPFVMQGVFAFAANHLAWLTTSNETRNLYLQHASVSLRGLHDAINTFSQANADAVLAASLLLLWQATDWRSWNSLRTGIQSVVAAMQSWQYNSVFHEFLDDDEVLLGSVRTHRRHSSIAPDDRSAVLENIAFSLQRLQLSLLGHEQENGWVAQLITYVEHLQGLHASPTPEEQFNTMYRLRKWLFWVPIALLEQQDGQGPALLTLAHFYATALVLQPLFPDLGATFCAAMATGPLNAIIDVTDAMQSHQGLSSSGFEIASMLQFPRQTALSYRSRALQEQQHFGAVPSPLQLSASALNFSAIGNLSPAFAASPMNYSGGPTTPQPGTPNSSYSPYLDPVHTPPPGYAYPAQSWSTGSASGHPLNTYTVVEEDMYSFDNVSNENFHSGFVTPIQTWT